MKRVHVWRSIVFWAVCAALFAAVVCWALTAIFPSLHIGFLGLAAFVSVQAVYLLRSFARKRGWALSTYAPDVD
jgi:hypothetical protein